jgi:hypothetical protein
VTTCIESPWSPSRKTISPGAELAAAGVPGQLAQRGPREPGQQLDPGELLGLNGVGDAVVTRLRLLPAV